MVVVWDPAQVKQIMGAEPDTFVASTPDALAAIVGYGSLFLQSGERHRRSRKLLMPPFHGERMKSYAELMASAAERWLQKRTVGSVGPILPVAQGVTLDVIIEAVFGEDDPTSVHTLHEQILNLVAAFHPLVATFRWMQRDFFGMGPWARLKRAARALDQTIAALMSKKRAHPGADVLSLLMSARDETGAPLDDQEIQEQLLTFVVAGHETTATSLAWALYELGRAPSAMERLRAELSAASDDPASLLQIPYLEQVICETLRRHPPVPIIPRKLARPFLLDDFELPAGQALGLAAYVAQHDPAHFAEPFSFKPERFSDVNVSPFQFFPFGGGARRCLGAAFAMYELKIVLGTWLKQAHFELDEPGVVGNAFRIGTYGPSTGIRVRRSR